jgi:hypothetical protein
VDDETRVLEERKLRLQGKQVWASFLGPLVAVVGAFLAFRGNLEAQATATQAQADAQTFQTLAESGDRLCLESGSPLFPLDSPSPAPGEVSGETPALDSGFGTSSFWPDVDLNEVCRRYVDTPPSLSVQRELIQQLVDHPDQSETILLMWRATYEADDWIQNIEDALHESRP